MNETWVPYMRAALVEAQIAMDVSGDVPVGAVLVDAAGEIGARGRNEKELLGDPTAHAEIRVLRQAANKKKNYRIGGTLYVTLEPCLMCAGALYWNKIGHIVFGAYDEKNSYRRVTEKNPFHPSTTLTGGILQEECAALMQSFFKAKR